MPDRPNILLITCHDLGRHVGCYGVKSARTRHIDQLAEEGVRFANSFCTAPQCSPSRAALFTGRYPHSNGVMGLTHARFGWDFNEDEVHLANMLQDGGYLTAGAGVIHEYRRSGAQTDQARGFERILPTGGNDANALAETCNAFIESRRGGKRPFYLQVGFFEPHRAQFGFGTAPDHVRGVTVPEYLVDTQDAREEFAYFQGAVHKVDRAIGQLLHTLKRTGQADDTIVVMTTDHGIPFPRAKCSLYDPGLESLLIMRWPDGPFETGKVYDELVSNVDVLPTLLDLADLIPPPEPGIQGRSFAGMLQGKAYQPREELFGEMTFHAYADPMRCVRTTTHKLIVNFTTTFAFMDPSQTWRPKTITVTPPDPSRAFHEPVELYDLEADPLEQKNVATDEAYAQVCDDLLTRLHEWMFTSNDPLLEGVPISPAHQEAIKALKTGKAT